MPRLGGLAFLTVLTVAALLACSGQALASHVQCGDVITEDTTLDSDLVDCPGDGIVIGADDIALDLNGHTINGTGVGTGVGNTGHPQVRISGGTVLNFRRGIVISGATENRIEQSDLAGNTSSGIVLEGSNGNTVVRNDISHPLGPGGFGIEVGTCCGAAPRSHGNLIAGNSVSRQDQGIRVIGSENRIERNRVGDTVDDGIVLTDSGNRVVGNVLLNTLYSGRAPFVGISGISLGTARASHIEGNRVAGYYDSIVLNDSTDNVIRWNVLSGRGLTGLTGHPVKGVFLFALSNRNTVADNAVSATAIGIYATVRDSRIERNLLTGNIAGVYVDRDSGNTVVRRNAAIDNLSEGITIDAPDTLVTRNVARDNGGDGIRVSFGSGNLVERNVANGNRLNGIRFLNAGGTIGMNKANRNGEFGIEAPPGVIDGGGSRARHNGNPLQCLNVVCR